MIEIQLLKVMLKMEKLNLILLKNYVLIHLERKI